MTRGQSRRHASASVLPQWWLCGGIVVVVVALPLGGYGDGRMAVGRLWLQNVNLFA